MNTCILHVLFTARLFVCKERLIWWNFVRLSVNMPIFLAFIHLAQQARDWTLNKQPLFCPHACFSRSKQIESACFSGTAAFMEVRIQSVVVEFILNHVDVLFSTKLSSLIREGAGTCRRCAHCRPAAASAPNAAPPSPGHNSLSRPKSLLVASPSTKLLSLEEAQARTQAQINSPVTEDSKYIEVGEGPAALQGKFHTVIEFPTERFVFSAFCYPDNKKVT